MANIQINIDKKKATTNFNEVVSFNNSDRLKFTFDEEWDEFPLRVAVAVWANGSSEQTFSGTVCSLPMIGENSSDFVLVGAYSVNGNKRIASTFVRLKCLTGAHSASSEKYLPTVQEQILAIVNGHECGKDGAIALANALTVGNKQFDGSAPVSITASDLSLAAVATSGNYNDLTNKPQLGVSQVTSVNGKTGEVSITKADLNLGNVLNVNALPLGLNVNSGLDFNIQRSAGIADYIGTSSAASQNAPISASNPSQNNGYWAVLSLGRIPNGVTQVAFSLRADCAIRIRNYANNVWTPWMAVYN